MTESRRFIHRDVKPDNILLDESGNAWLIDFGIARFYNPSASQDTAQLGTIGYAPPEQFGFSQSDFRSDLYAAGMTVLEMSRAVNYSPKANIIKAAKRCTEFDPNRRYDSADAVLRALNQRCRLPKLIALSAALLLVITTVIFWYLPYENEVPQVEPHIPATSNERYPEDNYIGTDRQMIEWIDIVSNYTGQGLKAFLVPAGSDSGAKNIQLAQEPSEITLHCELSNGVLMLTLNDHKMPEQQFSFSYAPSKLPDYQDTKTDAEIILYDMNGDGQDEILVAMSERILLNGVNDILICNTNWRAVWCIGYTPEEGFWQADGRLTSFSNDGDICLNYLGERELYCNNANVWMRLQGQSLRETN